MNTATNCILGYVSSKQSGLHFILQRQFFLFDFSSIRAIIHIVGTAILSRTNVDCVLLASMLNSIFDLLEKLPQHSNSDHQGRIQSPVKHDGASYQNTLRLLPPSFLFDRVMNSPLIIIQYFFLTKLSFKIQFFLRVAIKRET